MYSTPVSFVSITGALYKIYLTRSGEMLGFIEIFTEQKFGLSPVLIAIVVVPAGHRGVGASQDQTESQHHPPHDRTATPTAAR